MSDDRLPELKRWRNNSGAAWQLDLLNWTVAEIERLRTERDEIGHVLRNGLMQLDFDHTNSIACQRNDLGIERWRLSGKC